MWPEMYEKHNIYATIETNVIYLWTRGALCVVLGFPVRGNKNYLGIRCDRDLCADLVWESEI